MSYWVRLLTYPTKCLVTPCRGGKHWSLATLVNKQVTQESSEAETPASQYCPKDSRNRNLIDQLANRVSSKLEEGDYIGAVRIACSEDVITEYSTEILEALTSKHLSHTLRLQLSAS